MTAAVPSCPNALKSRYVAHYVTRPHGTIHRTSPRRHPAPERGRVAARAAAMEAELMRPLEQWAGTVADSEYSVEMHVRDSELDQFRVVNNAVYATSLQHCRHEFLGDIGIDCDALAGSGMALALTELRMRFLAPLRSRDALRVTLRPIKLTAVRATFEQNVYGRPRDGGGREVHALSAHAEVVNLNGEYKPTRWDPEHLRRMQLAMELLEGTKHAS